MRAWLSRSWNFYRPHSFTLSLMVEFRQRRRVYHLLHSSNEMDFYMADEMYAEEVGP